MSEDEGLPAASCCLDESNASLRPQYSTLVLAEVGHTREFLLHGEWPLGCTVGRQTARARKRSEPVQVIPLAPVRIQPCSCSVSPRRSPSRPREPCLPARWLLLEFP